jgi:hypothetical protein
VHGKSTVLSLYAIDNRGKLVVKNKDIVRIEVYGVVRYHDGDIAFFHGQVLVVSEAVVVFDNLVEISEAVCDEVLVVRGYVLVDVRKAVGMVFRDE